LAHNCNKRRMGVNAKSINSERGEQKSAKKYF
jgi:hypothetical protein